MDGSSVRARAANENMPGVHAFLDKYSKSRVDECASQRSVEEDC